MSNIYLTLSEQARQAAIGYKLMYLATGLVTYAVLWSREDCLAIDLLERSREFVQIPERAESLHSYWHREAEKVKVSRPDGAVLFSIVNR